MKKNYKLFLSSLMIIASLTGCSSTKTSIKTDSLEVKTPSERVALIFDAENLADASEAEDFFVGNQIGMTLNFDITGNVHGKGTQGLAYQYDVSEEGYTGANIKLEKPQNWSGAKGIKMFMKKDFSGNKAVIQFREANGEYWETSIPLNKDEAGEVYIPMKNFKQPGWGGMVDGKLDLSQISEFSLYVNEVSGQTKVKQGTLVYDDIEAVK